MDLIFNIEATNIKQDKFYHISKSCHIYIEDKRISAKFSPARNIRACSHGSGGPRQGEVPYLSVVKKYMSSHETPGTRGEVQNAITDLIVCSLFASMSLMEAKL